LGRFHPCDIGGVRQLAGRCRLASRATATFRRQAYLLTGARRMGHGVARCHRQATDQQRGPGGRTLVAAKAKSESRRRAPRGTDFRNHGGRFGRPRGSREKASPARQGTRRCGSRQGSLHCAMRHLPRRADLHRSCLRPAKQAVVVRPTRVRAHTAVDRAKNYVTTAIAQSFHWGDMHALNHFVSP